MWHRFTNHDQLTNHDQTPAIDPRSHLMTITAVHPSTSAQTPPKLRPASPTSRAHRDDLAALPAALRSEWIKTRSLRSNPAILGLTVVVGLILSLILAIFVKDDPNKHVPFTVGDTFIFSTWLTTVLAIVMGILLFTSELQHGTLANTLTAQPARWVIVAAKTAIAAGFGLAMGVVGMAAGFTGAVVGGLDMGDTSGMPATALWGLMLTSLAAVFGLGAGMIIRHSSAAISAALVWTLVVENLFRGFASPSVSRFLPFTAANGLLKIESLGDTPETMALRLTRVQDAILFGGYTVAALAIGIVVLYRRETR
jgi:ABC-2 type transport system permease protein